jgi:DHA1 family bicyclomycin/chloramphenicol resistance-like MFS transporter
MGSASSAWNIELAQVSETQRPSRLILFILIAAGGASMLSTDLYAPSLPHLPGYFGTSAETVQLTMALNMAAFAVAQLVWGPLSDRYGRRVVFLIGMTAFLFTAVGAALSQTIGHLLAARILMGASASVEAVIVLAVIGDIYRSEDSAKIYAIYGMIIALVPAAGPVIGGFVFEWFGWQANFTLLAVIIAAVLLLAALCLPETLATRERMTLRAGSIVSGYARLLSLRAFVTISLTLGLALGAIFAFITEAPFLLIDRHGVATRHYGLFQAAIVTAFFLGSFLSNRIVGRIGVTRLYGFGVAAASVSGLFMLLAVAFGDTPVTLTAAMSVFAFALGPLFASAPVLAFQQVGDQGRGMSAAMLATFEMAGASAGAFFVSVAPDGTAWPLAICVASASALILVAGVVGLRACRH